MGKQIQEQEAVEENKEQTDDGESASSSELASIVSTWGEEYTPAQKEIEKQAKKDSKVEETKVDENESDKPEEKPDVEAKEEKPDVEAKEEKPKEEPKEEPVDKDTAKRLALLEKQAAQIRAREVAIKEQIANHTARLEAYAKELEEKQALIGREHQEKVLAWKADPFKAIEELGYTFEELAIRNLKNKGMSVPQELEDIVDRQSRQRQPKTIVDEVDAKLEAFTNKIFERLEAKETQQQQHSVQQRQNIIARAMESAVDFVENNQDKYPFTAVYLKNPRIVAGMMMDSADELKKELGPNVTLHEAATYIEYKLEKQFLPAAQKKARTGQPSKQSAPTHENTRAAITLDNSTATDRASSKSLDPEEAYEQAWEQLAREFG